MRELSLFTGAGGGLLGAMLLGWETVAYVEWDKYCQQVIAARIADGILPAAPSLATCVSSYSPVQPASTEELSTWLAQAFPASPSASPASAPVQTTAATCGPPPWQPSARYDLASASWKTCQDSYHPDTSDACLATFPRAGMTVAGAFYRQPQWERRTGATASGLLPTPTVPNGGQTARSGNRRNEVPSLHGWATKGLLQMWPTPRAHETSDLLQGMRPGNNTDNPAATITRLTVPTPSASDWKGSSKPGQRRGQLTDPAMGAIPAGGKLNPTWVEWLMGWPPGWTDLGPLATDRFRAWLQQHGDC